MSHRMTSRRGRGRVGGGTTSTGSPPLRMSAPEAWPAGRSRPPRRWRPSAGSARSAGPGASRAIRLRSSTSSSGVRSANSVAEALVGAQRGQDRSARRCSSSPDGLTRDGDGTPPPSSSGAGITPMGRASPGAAAGPAAALSLAPGVGRIRRRRRTADGRPDRTGRCRLLADQRDPGQPVQLVDGRRSATAWRRRSRALRSGRHRHAGAVHEVAEVAAIRAMSTTVRAAGSTGGRITRPSSVAISRHHAIVVRRPSS